MIKKAGVGTRHEFDEKLRSLGTSLERVKQTFLEQALAADWRKMQLKHDEDPPTYDQMVAYYRQHQDEFTAPARAV